jgi:hypothetical protein
MTHKRYGLFNDQRVLMQTQEDLMGNGFPAPWVLLPEDFDIRKPTALSINNELLIAPSYDFLFNSEKDLWEVNLPAKKSSLLITVKRLLDLNLEAPISYNNCLFAPDTGNLIVWKDQVLPLGFVWRDINNNNIAADSSFINGLLLAIATRTNSLYQLLWQHKEAIRALSTVEQINSYNATAGWTVQISQQAIQSQFNPFNLG